MSATVNIWYGADLKNDGGFTLNLPYMGTQLDNNSYYEVMADANGYSLQEYRQDMSGGAPVWRAFGSTIPASTSILTLMKLT